MVVQNLYVVIDNARLTAEYIEDVEEWVASTRTRQEQERQFIRDDLSGTIALLISFAFLCLECYFPELLSRVPELLHLADLPWYWYIRPEVNEVAWALTKHAVVLVTAGVAAAVVRWTVDQLFPPEEQGYIPLPLVQTD